MNKNETEKLRQHYMQHPPEGMTKSLVKNMPDGDLLDMHHFLNEDLDEIFGGFLSSNHPENN